MLKNEHQIVIRDFTSSIYLLKKSKKESLREERFCSVCTGHTGAKGEKKGQVIYTYIGHSV
jgi:hypothetical protein